MKEYDRVTEIVSCFTNINQIPAHILKEASHRGTIVHKAVEAELRGIGIPELHEEIQKFFEPFLEWKKNNIIDPEWMERRFYCDDLKITGMMDILTKEGDLIDIKTGSSMQKSWPVQLGGYKYLLNKNKIYPKSFNILFLQKNKKAKWISYKIDEYENMFLHCHAVYKYFYKTTKS